MTAFEVAESIEQGIKNVTRQMSIKKIPLADGGEGTIDALANRIPGRRIQCQVTGPLGAPLDTFYYLTEQRVAIIEIAAICGLALIPLSMRNPMKTTTYGVGEIIIDALQKGARTFIIGLGGSGTNDGGIGMLQALGAKVYTEHNESVPFGGEGLSQVSSLCTKCLDTRLAQCTFTIITDVNSPLLGSQGATSLYGRQKGASNDMIELLDRAMEKYITLVEETTNKRVRLLPGSGASGGLGATLLAFFNARRKRGINYIMKKLHVEKDIQRADLVITGEGKIDEQTGLGKVPYGVASLARKYDVPVLAITGINEVQSKDLLHSLGIDAIFSITNGPMDREQALRRGKELTIQLTEHIFRLWLQARKRKDI